MSETLHTLNRSWGNASSFITLRRPGKYEGSTGTEYELCECWENVHRVTGRAQVVATVNVPLVEAPLWHHYNTDCRFLSGAEEALKKAYGPDFDTSEVTVLYLERMEDV